ncbi:MAG TPA: glycosyltransferase family 1 protein [Gammaproteobacteria bacterium]|nr:glycosyltransferase family 1 protein [Gammaproteobacteria bacterium]
MNAKRYRLLFILNVLNPGTGPFQRAVRLDPERLDITILSCMDSQEEMMRKAKRLYNRECGHRLVGLDAKSRLAFILRLCRVMLEVRPDIIQVNHTFSAVVAILFSLLISTPVRVAFEGTLLTRYGYTRRFFMSLIYSLTDGVISVSKAVKSINHTASGKLGEYINRRVIYNGVDIGDIDRIRELPLTKQENLDDAFVIGYVGDLKPLKDVGTLIRAFAQFVEKWPENSRLVIIGGGAQESALKSIANEVGVIDRTIFTGQIERRSVYEFLPRLDVFVMPSRVEGLSEAIVQAMAAEVPVIASDIAPNRELISHGTTGLIFEPGNEQALTDALVLIAGDIEIRKEFSRRSREFVERKLDIFHIVDEYHDFYKELISRKELDGYK